MIKINTIEELATDAFEKAEIVRCMGMVNTPVDYEERKKAFVALEVAKAAALEASSRLIAFKMARVAEAGHKLEASDVV